ncbi:MAG TPA: hypothetical protein PLL10_09300, partial [Elusimicrobiales bacterium]|nr:hypothetical protein [Elusimicrobiales bacterium]
NGNISADYGITSSSFTASTWLKAAGVVTVVSTGLATSQNITVSSSAYITGNLFVGGITMGENIGLGATGPSSGISYLVFVKDFASYKAFNYGVTESRLAFVSRQSDGTMTGSGAMSWGYNGTYDTSGAYFSLGVMTTGGTVSGMIHMRGTDRIGYRVASPLTSHHFGGDVRMDNQLVVYGSMTVYGTDGVQLRGAIDMSVGGYGTNSTMLMGPGAASRANLRTQGGYGVWAITNTSNLPLIKFNTTAAQVVVSSGNFILDGTTPSIGVRTNNPAAPIHSIGEVRVSTATTSSASLCLAGTFQTLPTTGWNEGCIAWQLDDHKVYVATQTVVAVDSWKALW